MSEAWSDELRRVMRAIEAIEKATTPQARAGAITDAKRTAASEIESLEDTIAENQRRIDALEEEAEGKAGEAVTAINRLLDEVERPVGKLHFIVPNTPAVDRALLGLHDAVCRSL